MLQHTLSNIEIPIKYYDKKKYIGSIAPVAVLTGGLPFLELSWLDSSEDELAAVCDTSWLSISIASLALFRSPWDTRFLAILLTATPYPLKIDIMK